MNENNNFDYNPKIENAWLKRFEDCMNAMTAQSVHRLRSFWHKDILVETPLFNEKGRNVALANMKHIIASLNISKCKIIDMSLSTTNPHVFYARWEMKTLVNGGTYIVSGMSEYTLDIKQPLIVHQKDFWNPDPLFQLLSPFYRWGLGRVLKKI